MRIQDYCDTTEGALVLRMPLQQFVRGEIVTDNTEMKRQLDILERVSKTNSPITIIGEKGSGKDVIARYAHQVSGKSRGPFLKTNCAYLPEEQMYEELFGTDAHRETGLLSHAAGGSLYIENADLMPKYVQYKLMDHIFRGGAEDTRFMICLKNPDQMTTQLSDRMLFYFDTITFHVPPLRKRPEDILLLTFYHLKQIQEDYHILRTISPEVMSAMLTHDWTANTRELAQTLERMAFLSDSTLLDSVPLFRRCLSSDRQLQALNPDPPAPPAPKSLKQIVQDYEVMIINQYIERYGSLRKAAVALKSSPATLSRKITEYNLQPSENEK